MAFNVAEDVVLTGGPDGLNEVAAVPEVSIPELLPEGGELHEETAAGDAFEPPGDICHRELRRRGYETVDMVFFTDFGLDDGEPFLFTDLPEQDVQTFRHIGGQDFPAVLHAPDDMIVDVIDAGASMDIITHTYSI